MVASLKNGQDHTLLACSQWIGQSNTNPLNYPINLLESDLCKTKVLKWLLDLCLIGWMIKRGLICASLLVGIDNRPPKMFFVVVRVTQEEETRLWDWLCCFAKMAEGTKSLYLSAALYFLANFCNGN